MIGREHYTSIKYLSDIWVFDPCIIVIVNTSLVKIVYTYPLYTKPIAMEKVE